MAMQYQDMGDLIGAESCIDFGPDVTATLSNGGAARKLPRGHRRSNAAAPKEYPPLLPSLTRTTKYSTVDGRLIITEEKVQRRREYLQAHRSDGRLILVLVPLDGGENAEEEIDGGDDEVEAVHPEKGKYEGAGGNAYGGFAAAVAAAVAELRPPVLTGETF